MLTEFSEPDFFFRVEFALALANIDLGITSGMDAEHRVPLPGLYLYMHEAHDPIAGLLLEQLDWLESLYAHSLSEILDCFDRNAHRVIAPYCSPLGLLELKTSEIYQEAIRKRPAKA